MSGWTPSRESANLRHSFWQERVRQETGTRRDELGEIVRKAKEAPCKDCGVQYPYYVMHFDHVQPETKLFNIAQWGDLLPSKERLLEEIAKCELVCANCHAERTWQRDKVLQKRRGAANEAKRQAAQRKAQALGVPAVPYKSGSIPVGDRREKWRK